jgi:hypothetical protein
MRRNAHKAGFRLSLALADPYLDIRSETLKAAFIANPRRFKGKLPTLAPPLPAVGINQPSQPPSSRAGGTWGKSVISEYRRCLILLRDSANRAVQG